MQRATPRSSKNYERETVPYNSMSALELKIPPPVVAVLAGTAMWFASPHPVPPEFPLFLRLAAFIGVALIGGGIALAGDLAFKRASTTINPMRPENTTALVTTGIYRRTRNPMYVGLTLVLIGWAAFLCFPWTLIGPAVFVLYITRFQIAPEESILSAKFGQEYDAYRSRVRRWL